jgi:NAD(P)H-dependent flavin oxidoreductase YrpB (nitropropane dioxygenase family)
MLPKIIAAPMTGVSDAKLAIACDRVGITGSISIFMDVEDPIDNLERQLAEFSEARGHTNLIVSYGDLDKIFPAGSTQRQFDVLRKWKVKYLYQLNPRVNMPEDFTVIGRDYVVYKTEKAAGQTYVASDGLQEKIESASVPVICAGGVYDKNDAQAYFDLGAHSVAVGTILACSVESSIPLAVKHHMIASTENNLSRFKSDDRQGLFIKNIDDSDFNHYNSLYRGLKGGDGHVYAGTAIDRITELETVEEIAQRLL